MSSGKKAAKRGTDPTTGARRGGAKVVGATSSVLANENSQLKQTVEGLEREDLVLFLGGGMRSWHE